MMANPFFEPSDLPYALPPFARIRHEHYLPAFERGMAEQREEIAAIGSRTAPPTFENTVEALERSGAVLGRVSRVFFNKAGSDTDDALQALEAELAPRLAAHDDALLLDPALFARLDALYEAREDLALDPEQVRVLERHHTLRVRAGAGSHPTSSGGCAS
ncbi:hypothetical protein PQR15_01450 [Streptomyces lydicus]|nr:hypothetical protein [Streptomyces lydicus]